MNMHGDIKHMLLLGWEEVYKKSQLTLWILLALREGEKNMQLIKDFICTRTHGSVDADDKSMYRALRRFDEADLIIGRSMPNPGGPDVKLWHLTETGSWVLEQFIARNITGVLLDSQNKKLFTDHARNR